MKVLIIGGTGTLGQALVDELLKHDVESIRIYARNEYKMWQMRQKYGEPVDKLRYFIGDIRDNQRLNMAFEDVDIVFNCAALKHVSLCNENPFEALQTNSVGVQNALECAVQHNVKMFVQISTDKAINPVNLYGCTKAVSEYLVLDAPNWSGKARTKFVVVRSGNIMASTGSCLEIWKRQHENGEPLTVTDLEAERYMASKKDIANAIVDIALNPSSGLYVLSMPKYKVKDLIQQFEGSKLNVVGLQHGEKLCEELYRDGEKFTLVEV